VSEPEPRFKIGDVGRKVGIIDTKKNLVAVFYGNNPQDLWRRLKTVEAGLNSGEITTRDWVWEEYKP
jgi:hypothetical protein